MKIDRSLKNQRETIAREEKCTLYIFGSPRENKEKVNIYGFGKPKSIDLYKN